MFQSEPDILQIESERDFNRVALKVFRKQVSEIPVYREYAALIGCDVNKVNHYTQIPFLPVSFFKTHKLVNGNYQHCFTSSGTTKTGNSKHYVKDLSIYEKSYTQCFKLFYGLPEEYVILGLLPDYLERSGASLVYMVNGLIKQSKNPLSGFYLYNHGELHDLLIELESKNQKTMLIGVSFALLDFIEKYTLNLNNTIVMETGGMKGRRREPVKQELHEELSKGFGINKIHSEYGMTELLSQAYSKGDNLFSCPPWMKILIRDAHDPFTLLENGRSGGINIIDLANIHSCSFISVQDLGVKHSDNEFEVLGRFDNSDLRGCNLMIQ